MTIFYNFAGKSKKSEALLIFQAKPTDNPIKWIRARRAEVSQ